MAESSLRELETHLEILVRVDLASERSVHEAVSLSGEVGRLLGGLHRPLKRPPKNLPPNS